MSKRILVAVLALVAVVAGSGTAAEVFRPAGGDFSIVRSDVWHEGSSYVESIELLFNVQSGGALSLGTSIGSINVRTWSEEKVRLVITKSANAPDEITAKRLLELFRVQATHGGKDVSLNAKGRTSECEKSVGVVFTVWVPKSYNLDIQTRSGSIGIGKVDGTFNARTGDGSITVDIDPDELDIEVEDKTESRPSEPEAEPAAPRNDTLGAGDVR